jgi:hypothetical protein
MGYEYVYTKLGVMYSPGVDSIALGSQIVVEAAAPKTFLDEEKNINVTLSENKILGPFSVSKIITTPYLSFAGAIDDVVLTPLHGSLIKDSILFTQSQLSIARTAVWDGNSLDSFRLKIIVKPNIRGTYFLSLRDQGNRNAECALFKYLVRVKNIDQHFYLMTPVTNGEISDIAANFVYCFKVY